MSYAFSTVSDKIILDNYQPLTTEAWILSQASPCGIVVNKVAMGQVFLRVL
jgi:hypothetical protein